MPLNTTIAFPNPTKARSYGLADTIREDGYAYSTIYTVLNTETLKIRQGMFAINYNTVDACYISVYLNIAGIRFTIFQEYVGAATRGNTKVSLTDILLDNFNLKTGDTIKIEYVYTTGTVGVPTGAVKAALLLDDYTA